MEQPLADGLVMSLTCMALLSQRNPTDHFDIIWSGIGIEQKSVWLRQSNTVPQGSGIMNKLLFRPLLSSHIGKYTCYLMMNNKSVASTSIIINGM